MQTIVFDDRWSGEHGIGRFTREVRTRLPGTTIDLAGCNPVSPLGLLELERVSWGRRSNPALFFSPGYTPPIRWSGPVVFTVHDLIHLDVPEERSNFKTLYYNRVVRPAMHRAQRVLTVSEYSRQRLLEWSGVAPEQVVVVGNGVDSTFAPEGRVHQPGYPYVLCVSNTKPHKNVRGLLQAFAQLDLPDLRLVLSGRADAATRHETLRLGIDHRVVFTGRLSEGALAAHYRGAEVVTLPSLYEGFGLPPLEAMASGIPVVVSDTTSLPEVVGNAGLLVDPRDPESIADGLNRAVTDTALRQTLRARGLERVRMFCWDDVARRVRRELGPRGVEWETP